MTNALTTLPNIIERALATDPRLRSPHTRNQYAGNLRDFEAFRRGQELTKTLVETYASILQKQGLAPSTINQKLATIRWWARKWIDLAADYAPAGTAERVAKNAARVSLVRDVKGSRAPAGRHIEPYELRALLEACDDTTPGIRDRAMLSVALSTGLRRAEIASLRLVDLRALPDGTELHITGKGDKFRIVDLVNGALSSVNAWLPIRGTTPGYLFCRLYKGDSLPKKFTKPLSGEALRGILDTRANTAGIEPLTWHDFRRTLAGNLWGAGIDGSTIQDILGHASQDQSKKYDRRPLQRRREALETVNP